MRPAGYCIAAESWRTGATRYFVARVYLDSAERREYETKVGPDQRAWLLGRIAAKDALRQVLWKSGMRKLFPVQIHVTNDVDGRPIARGPWQRDLRLSVAHKSTIAAAIVAEGVDVGIDIELVQPRDSAFLTAAFSRDELALLPGADFDVWVTRAWVAKEAVSKATGTGLNGRPRGIELSAIDGERLCVDGQWIETRLEGNHVVGWTDVPTIGGAGGHGVTASTTDRSAARIGFSWVKD
jgi:phosphopantetheinyl transferase